MQWKVNKEDTIRKLRELNKDMDVVGEWFEKHQKEAHLMVDMCDENLSVIASIICADNHPYLINYQIDLKQWVVTACLYGFYLGWWARGAQKDPWADERGRPDATGPS